MKLCENGHDPIVYKHQLPRCPLCEAYREIEDLKFDKQELEKQIDKLIDEVENKK